jgi:hypothetical protein
MDIEIRPDLLSSLRQDAERQARSVSDLVNEAVEGYLRERDREKLEAEIAAFTAMHAELKQRYFGEWVAVHEGRVIDHDRELAPLYARIRQLYPRTAVLMRQVEEEPERDLMIRSPRVEPD